MSVKQDPSRSLPVKASEEFLRKEAKRLSKRHGVGLAEAQRMLAHEYGHRNWADLMTAAKTVLQPALAPTRSEAKLSRPSQTPLLRDEEWATILSLAETSVAEMPVAPGLKQWLKNRKAFADSGGIQQHFVATLGKQIVGYACAENPPAWMRSPKNAAGQYRLFVVVEPSARTTLGTRLLAKLRESLIGLGARRVWFQEYEPDSGLISFLEQRGFVKAVSFRAQDGTRIVRLFMDAPFETLKEETQRPNNPSAQDHETEDSR